MYNIAINLYAILVRLVSPFNRKARLMIKGHRDVYRKLKAEIDPQAKYIWLHAASLGEFEQGRPMIESIKANYPSYKILLTFFSPSGYEVRKNYDLADVVCYLPFDKRRNVKRFLRLAKPQMAIFIKYEFWYNYINRLRKLNTPVYMVSAIFRPNQMFFRWYGRRYRRMLHYYKCICVQDESSKQLLSEIGIVQNVRVCGDTRFDRVLEIRNQAKQLPLVEKFVSKDVDKNQLTLVAGSTWPKDEDILIKYFNTNPNLKLIIVPHEIHEAHLRYIESVIQRPSIRYSEANADNIGLYDCMIVDSFGLLSSLYAYGQIAYVGGGFGVGIHNILEAAVYGIPVIFGPNFKKFREAHQLIELGGGYPVKDEETFTGLMNEFTQYSEVLSVAGKYAGDYVRSNSGVVKKVMNAINLKD